MCNEAARLRSLGEISAAFSDLKIRLVFPEGSPNLAASDSIRITDPAAIVRRHDGADQLVQRRWSWAGAHGKPVYNFRSEGRRFVNSATGGRCLIPLDGFYEFTAAEPPAKRKTKWLFTVPDPIGGADNSPQGDANTDDDRSLFCVAGLWRALPGADGAASRGSEAFTMLTCAPGPDIAPYHDRQIVLMPSAHWGDWLAGAEGLIAPTPAGTLRVTRVG